MTIGSGFGVNQLPQVFPRSEVRYSLRRNLDGLTGLGVTTDSCFSFLHTKAAKASEFNLISGLKRINDTIQDLLDNDFSLLQREIGVVSYFMSQISFCDGTPPNKEARILAWSR